ncbi:hypothetical protein SUGI_0235870 [Cryptomeria japonica]|nr:hypothetical protein SUGI_0235870 [Cryptomeria japonica]
MASSATLRREARRLGSLTSSWICISHGDGNGDWHGRVRVWTVHEEVRLPRRLASLRRVAEEAIVVQFNFNPSLALRFAPFKITSSVRSITPTVITTVSPNLQITGETVVITVGVIDLTELVILKGAKCRAREGLKLNCTTMASSATLRREARRLGSLTSSWICISHGDGNGDWHGRVRVWTVHEEVRLPRRLASLHRVAEEAIVVQFKFNPSLALRFAPFKITSSVRSITPTVITTVSPNLQITGL